VHRLESLSILKLDNGRVVAALRRFQEPSPDEPLELGELLI